MLGLILNREAGRLLFVDARAASSPVRRNNIVILFCSLTTLLPGRRRLHHHHHHHHRPPDRPFPRPDAGAAAWRRFLSSLQPLLEVLSRSDQREEVEEWRGGGGANMAVFSVQIVLSSSVAVFFFL